MVTQLSPWLSISEISSFYKLVMQYQQVSLLTEENRYLKKCLSAEYTNNMRFKPKFLCSREQVSSFKGNTQFQDNISSFRFNKYFHAVKTRVSAQVNVSPVLIEETLQAFFPRFHFHAVLSRERERERDD